MLVKRCLSNSNLLKPFFDCIPYVGYELLESSVCSKAMTTNPSSSVGEPPSKNSVTENLIAYEHVLLMSNQLSVPKYDLRQQLK